VTGPLHAIDCDVHPTVPDMKALLPYLDDFWRETVEERGINSLETVTYPPNAPLTARAQWRGKNGRAATAAVGAHRAGLRPLAGGIAICNCLYGVGLLFSEDMAAAFTRAPQRLGGQGMARSRSAPAGVDRGADAEHRVCGR
jgi:hypothetical protein